MLNTDYTLNCELIYNSLYLVGMEFCDFLTNSVLVTDEVCSLITLQEVNTYPVHTT